MEQVCVRFMHTFSNIVNTGPFNKCEFINVMNKKTKTQRTAPTAVAAIQTFKKL